MDSYKRIIVVSGINGCGKTTFIEKIKEVLVSRGATVDVLKAPFYDSATGQLIKEYLAGNYVDDIEHVFALNRSEVYWKMALSNANFVLVDRLDLDAEVFATLRNKQAKFYGKRPLVSMQIVLDVDEDIAYDRLMKRPITQQIYYNKTNLKTARGKFLSQMQSQRWGRKHMVLDSGVPFSSRKLNAVCNLLI